MSIFLPYSSIFETNIWLLANSESGLFWYLSLNKRKRFSLKPSVVWSILTNCW